MIRDAKKNDAGAICEIYNYYVLNTIISFEETPASIEEMSRRIEEVILDLPWLVFEEEGKILGFAYATKWQTRRAYRHSVESTVYVSNEAVGLQIGEQLYEALILRLHDCDIHSVIGGIALPNVASENLHQKLGFEKVAQFKEVGWKFNKWIDVGYWELRLPIKKCSAKLDTSRPHGKTVHQKI
jgi:L-amino acid N-acyltransferase YncA